LISIVNVLVLNLEGRGFKPPKILIRGNTRLAHLNRNVTIGTTAVIAAPNQCSLPVAANKIVVRRTAMKPDFQRKDLLSFSGRLFTRLIQIQLTTTREKRRIIYISLYVLK
tara:strand:+ start:5303 stop:5635 length:333 start_codon:yes stop_codon:yes gene_type:complete